MWVAKEKVGDNSIDFMAVPVPVTPPASPPLPNRSRNRRSSLVKAIQRFRSGTSPGGVGEGAEQDRPDDDRANRCERAGERTGAAVAAVTRLSTPGEGSAGTISYKTLEEGRVRRKLDNESSTELLIGVGPCEGEAATDAEIAEAAVEATRDTTPPIHGGGDDSGEGVSSRDSSSRRHSERRLSNLEKIFSPSTDLSL